MCYRNCVDLKTISSLSLDKTAIVDTILQNPMTSYYWGLLCSSSEHKEYILERCVKLYLTLRGHSTAKSVKLQLEKNKDESVKP